MNVTIGADGPFTAKFGAKPLTLAAARGVLESAIRAAAADKPAFSGATVTVLGSKLLVLAGGGGPAATVTFAASAGDATTAVELKLTRPQAHGERPGVQARPDSRYRRHGAIGRGRGERRYAARRRRTDRR